MFVGFPAFSAPHNSLAVYVLWNVRTRGRRCHCFVEVAHIASLRTRYLLKKKKKTTKTSKSHSQNGSDGGHGRFGVEVSPDPPEQQHVKVSMPLAYLRICMYVLRILQAQQFRREHDENCNGIGYFVSFRSSPNASGSLVGVLLFLPIFWETHRTPGIPTCPNKTSRTFLKQGRCADSVETILEASSKR